MSDSNFHESLQNDTESTLNLGIKFNKHAPKLGVFSELYFNSLILFI
jgi:hypothetical protein